jgi:hypothetical protein
LVLFTGAAWIGCGGSSSPTIGDGDSGADGESADSGKADGATDSGSQSDSGGGDSGTGGDSSSVDSGGGDTGSGSDTGSDTGTTEAGTDAGCPAPVTGSVYVSPTGSDVTGNGSQTCPFVTITKALSTTIAASVATTVFVASGTAATPDVYGAGCTAGAGLCDATPIHVTNAMSGGILIRGTISPVDPAAVVVTGGITAADDAVFLVSAPNVGFQNLTVTPKRIATGTAPRVEGTIGIEFVAGPVSTGSEASVTSVVINGISKGSTSESTGSGIAISGGTSPTVGPGVTIVGGDHSVLVTQAATGATTAASHPTITSNDGQPSFFHSSQFACVRVETTNATATLVPTATVTASNSSDPGRLHLQDCGGNGGVVVDTAVAGKAVTVANTLIDTSGAAAPANYGIRLQHSGVLSASTAVTVTGMNAASAGGAGIEATDASSLAITAPSGAGVPGVIVATNAVNGVHVGSTARANIDTLTSTGNVNGLLCDASSGISAASNLVLRNSTLLENRSDGVLISASPGGTSCAADLGSNTGAGNNTFNTTARKNAFVGLCYMPVTAVTATKSTWACGLASGAACTPATGTTPAPVVVANCQLVGDYNANSSLVVALPQTCCGM